MSFIDYIILIPLLTGAFCSALLYGYVLVFPMESMEAVSRITKKIFGVFKRKGKK